MTLTSRENYLRTVKRQDPEWIPVNIIPSGASWLQLREDLEDVVARHPLLFPDFEKGKHDFDRMQISYTEQASKPFRDAWGVLWDQAIDGIVGQAVEHPLDDWDKFEDFQPPDPVATNDHKEPVEWPSRKNWVEKQKAAGNVATGGLAHGFYFMRLYYLRGFENLMMDIGLEEPRLDRLIRILIDANTAKVHKWLEMDLDVMKYPEDLGTQTASMISPASFARYCTPAYAEMMKPAKDAGVLVHMHSDGYIVEIVDELHKAGVDIVNPQDLCNGLDNIKRTMKGRFCIDLDIDRQKIVPFGTAAEIEELIEEEVGTLGSPDGGLMFIAGIYPPTPAENVDALCSALEKYRTWWWDCKGRKA